MVLTDKHVINSPENLVLESLQGLCRLNPNVSLDSVFKVLYQKSPDRSKVTLISGGGAGHEPAHAGFVGSGMLTAAVSGSVFASPNANQVTRAIDLVHGEKGTLIVVKNYTGDVLHFGLAKEKYAAANPQKVDRVRFLVVADDVSVGKTAGGVVGRRGLAGTVLVYKIAGALAAQGESLDEVFGVAQTVASRVGTIGVGLEHCHVPGTGSSQDHLASDEIEVGMGIHNEPGFMRLRPVPPLAELIPQLLEKITSITDTERFFLPFKHDGKDKVVLLVNNLGGISELELANIAGETVSALEKMNINVARLLAGTYMTSLNMPGFSITLLLLPRSSDDANAPSESTLLNLLDHKPDTPGWKWTSSTPPQRLDTPDTGTRQPTAPVKHTGEVISVPGDEFNAAVEKACERLIESEAEITRMDQICGDGDCGLTLKAGATGILKELKAQKITGDDLVAAVMTMSTVVDTEMDGTSGALFSIYFSALAQGLGQAKQSADLWKAATTHALERLYEYTAARPPSRTLLDPLAAFTIALQHGRSFKDAVNEAGTAADATKDLGAKAGRASYIKKEHLAGVSDPGAVGVYRILQGLLEGATENI